MYVYHRQCHKALKPTAVFPIEVQLGVDTTPLRSEAEEKTPPAMQSSQSEEEQTHEE